MAGRQAGDVLAKLGCGDALIERILTSPLNPRLVVDMHTQFPTSLRGVEDAAVLATLASMPELTDVEVLGWASVGPLRHGVRLILKGVPLRHAQIVRAQHPSDPDLAEHLVAMVLAASQAGMSTEDHLRWWLGGVLRLPAPHLDDTVWRRWRRASLATVGLAWGSVAAAAGMSVEEVYQAHDDGTFDKVGVSLLAQLRGDPMPLGAEAPPAPRPATLRRIPTPASPGPPDAV